MYIHAVYSLYLRDIEQKKTWKRQDKILRLRKIWHEMQINNQDFMLKILCCNKAT